MATCPVRSRSLWELIQSKANPYIDFAVFGPNGLRLLRGLTFQAISLNSQGEWQQKEMPGPPDYEAWFQIFCCVLTTFLLLESASAERMDAYTEHIRHLCALVPTPTGGIWCTQPMCTCVQNNSRGSVAGSMSSRNSVTRKQHHWSS